MPYINLNGQLTEVSQAEFNAYNNGTSTNPAGGGSITQLNNTQEILNPNTTNNIPGNRLPSLSEQIAAAGLSPPASQLSAADQANIDALNRIEANRAQPGSDGSLPTQADFAALRQAQIDRNGGVDPNAVPPDVQAQLDRINAREPGPPLGTLSEQLAAAGLSPPPSQLSAADQATIDALNRIEARKAASADTPYTAPTPQENIAALNAAGFGPPPVTAEGQANIDAINRIEANKAASADTPYRAPTPQENIASIKAAQANSEDPFEAARLKAIAEEDTEPRVFTAEDLGVDTASDAAILAQQEQQALNRAALKSEDNLNAASEAATIAKAKAQATYQARYKQPGNGDWRVRLVLAEGADYLYKANPPGILKPLAQSNGVIFPYTPQIQTNYAANYEQYDLVHSNYRGYFYKNSKVGDINVTATFTAQDTQEAEYMLAVIHFFRSVTKMFYGQDAQRGAPPPIVYLVGLGDFQFNGHACLVSNFQYTLPSDVDYIRANNPNNYGTNMLNRVSASTTSSSPAASAINRLSNAIDNFGRSLQIGALSSRPSPGAVPGSVNNLNRSTYVPTKIEINLTLLPVQSRAQVSQQFSLKGFANGDLLKGGFW